MTDNTANWVQVKSEDELRPGLTVELRPCGFCGRRERQVLLRMGEKTLSLHHSGDLLPGSGKGWFVAPGLCLNPRRPFDVSAAIPAGRLWRLSDQALKQTASERQVELLDRR